MKSVIYYFTGTGNTLAVARALATQLGDTGLIPLRRAISPGGACITADVVGIAFPVYFLDMPGIVRQFVQQLRFDGTPYIYGIATCGGRPGGALYRLVEALETRGSRLSSGFSLVMPENYLGPIDLMEPEEEAEKRIAAAQERIAEIARAVDDRQVAVPEGTDSAALRIGGSLTRFVMTSLYRVPRRLHATGRCNRCGLCEKICPTGNISLDEDAVRFGNACTQCYACIHWCPQQAIEIGGRTEGKRRYHHPDVTIRDMLDQRGE